MRPAVRSARSPRWTCGRPWSAQDREPHGHRDDAALVLVAEAVATATVRGEVVVHDRRRPRTHFLPGDGNGVDAVERVDLVDAADGADEDAGVARVDLLVGAGEQQAPLAAVAFYERGGWIADHLRRRRHAGDGRGDVAGDAVVAGDVGGSVGAVG